MGGGLLQLVAYGAQDVYLTGNPQITFFKVVYRRHTNFAIESIQQTFNGNAGYGQSVSATISRNGDLINRTYLQISVPKLKEYVFGNANTPRYVNYLGLRLIKDVSVEIGGQPVDKHYSDWMYIWNELSLPLGKRSGYEMMVGADGDVTSSALSNSTLYVPLEFWFCRNVGLSLPLIALQYHEVKIKISFENMNKCIKKIGTDTTDYKFAATLWVDYIFLDTDERRRFAQLSHEYLIEQLQFTGSESLVVDSGNRFRLNFNHPCKELIWVARKQSDGHQWYNYTDADTLTSPIYTTGDATSNVVDAIYPTGDNPITRTSLQLNGNDRFSAREGGYFNYVQPYQHHTNIPTNKGINVYSFALKPEEHQPSGTLNMSRIDTAVLALDSSINGKINIYAVNYNVLRIMSGMGGVAYSN